MLSLQPDGYYRDRYATPAPANLWPDRMLWRRILLAAALQLDLDPQHDLLCHLAQRVAARKNVSWDAGYDFVADRIVAHLEHLARDLRLDPAHARAIGEHLWKMLNALRYSSGATAPYWPTRAEWLAVDRAAAALIGLNGCYTLTTNLASLNTSSKAWVHARIASQVGALARDLGFNVFQASGIAKRFARWLNSFE